MWNRNYSHSWGSCALFHHTHRLPLFVAITLFQSFLNPKSKKSEDGPLDMLLCIGTMHFRCTCIWKPKEWFSDLHCQENFYFYSFFWRQRYVDLLERIPQQMKTLYRKMMARRLVDRHITEELLYFKECVSQLSRSESFLILKNYLSALSLAYWFCSVFKSFFHRSRQLFF